MAVPDGNGCSVELVSQEAITAREMLGRGEDLVGELDRLSIDFEILDCECQPRKFPLDRESRK